MSIDAGGLAQMTYQSPFNNTIGVSGPGFGTRGKATHVKRLSVAPPSKISTIDETQQMNTVSTPRTARGHLLAGLRTAPKSATVPSSNSVLGLDGSRYGSQYSERLPQTATATGFPGNHQLRGGANYSGYSMPEVLAPPAIEFNGNISHGVDQNLYDELVATNNYLAEQQRNLQQQLLNVQYAAQQFGRLDLTNNMMGHTNLMQPSANPLSNLYNQQFQQGIQPIVQPVAGSPGLFAVYNPMTGQSSFVVDNSAHQDQDPTSARVSQAVSPSPVNVPRQSPDHVLSSNSARSRSPPKSTPSPSQDHEPLPPPSANAFRRGHKKNLSSVNIKTTGEWTRNVGPKSAGIMTPMTGTFGPGQGRAGDQHPVRQPRGPPLIQDLQDKPTSKHEGSKNFATRQRRRAVHDLVRAGRERTENRQSGSGSGTPASETEFNFSASSDNEDLLARSTTLSSKPSLGSLRAAANGAIGSERKEKSRERTSVDSTSGYSVKSLSSDEGNSVGGNIVEVENTRRRTPHLVLSNAEKRKSLIM